MKHNFTVGARVRYSDAAIEPKRDYWNNCGREPMKAGARRALEDAIAARGTITSIVEGKFAMTASVRWDDGRETVGLLYQIAIITERSPV